MTRFVPTRPARGSGPVATWRGFVGERARTSVYGWSGAMFEQPYYRREMLGFTIHMPLAPEGVEQVVLKNAANYVRPRLAQKILAPMIGEGLLTANGDLWRDQRRIVAASFSPAAVESQRPVFARSAAAASAAWTDGETRDLAEDATRATLLIIAEALFSGDPRLTRGEALGHITRAIDGIAGARVQALLGLPMVPITPSGHAARRGRMYLREVLGGLVDERRAQPSQGDFLQTLIDALAERFPPEQARSLAIDNAATFYLAGHETTSNALAWTLYLLSEQPELQDKLAAEAKAALGWDQFPDRPVTERLPGLHATLQESLRLYPPAPRFDRQAIAGDTLMGHRVEAGHVVVIWPWMLHRHQALWEDPDAFDPDRFAPGKPKPGRYQYLPFGAGQRICVGAQFATAEALTVLAYWLADWRFLPSGRPVEVSGLITMRPKGGLPLRLERRPA